MDQTQMNRIEEGVERILEAISGGALSPRTDRVGPGVTVIDGAVYDLAEPVARDFVPSMTVREFTRLKQIAGEPSNAAPGMPRRSPAGYPLFYPGLAWNGHGDVAGAPRVIFGESTFADDGEVERWKADAARRDANNLRAGGSFAGYRPGSADG